MRSLERAIISRIVLTLFAAGAVAIAVTYEAARYEANEFMDDYLRQFAHATEPTSVRSATDGGLREPEDRFERLIWKKGTKLFATAKAPKIDMQPDGSGFRDFQSDDENWRGYVIARDGFVLMLAQRVRAREELAQHAALQVSVIILATMLIVWLIVRWTVGRTMRRLNLVSGEIAVRGIDAKDPLPGSALPDEFRPLVEAMNVLAERLQGALRQQRQFVADSAHELRTPLTALRIQIDNLCDAGASETEAATRALRDGIARASGVLNQLLRLARFDGREAPEHAEIIDLGDIVTQGIADAVDVADAAGIDIGMTAIAPVRVRMVRADLQLLVSNVIDNAIRYTPRGGTVDCALLRTEAGATIEVTDTGPGVPREAITRLTERFFRAAGIDIPGSGLGLAIVKAIADSYDLTLAIENRANQSGLVVSLSFPSGLLCRDEVASSVTQA